MSNRLIDGYKKFRNEYFKNSKAFEPLVKYGQKPFALVIACCDSRADPAIITGAKPGDLFVVRNIANLVPPFADDPRYYSISSALEFGVNFLEVSEIIIFGHKHCGGIQALMSQQQSTHKTDFIHSWMNVAQSAKQKVLDKYPNGTESEHAHCCEKESLLISLNNLNTYPWIKQRVQDNKLSLHAWYFDMDSGNIESYSKELDKFVILD